jgi:hypothetical protein
VPWPIRMEWLSKKLEAGERWQPNPDEVGLDNSDDEYIRLVIQSIERTGSFTSGNDYRSTDG